MENNKITFDNLPEAVDYLINEMAEIRQLISRISTEQPDRRLPVDIDEACKIVSKAKSTVYTLVRKGLIPCYKVGKKLYFYEDELLDWIEAGRKKSIAETKADIEMQMRKNIRHKPKCLTV